MEKIDIPNIYFLSLSHFYGFPFNVRVSHNLWGPNKGKLRSEPRGAQITTLFTNKMKRNGYLLQKEQMSS